MMIFDDLEAVDALASSIRTATVFLVIMLLTATRPMEWGINQPQGPAQALPTSGPLHHTLEYLRLGTV